MNFKKTILLSAIVMTSLSSVVSAGPSTGYGYLNMKDGDKVTSNIPPICMVEVIQTGSDLAWNKDSTVKLEFRTQNNMSAETTITLKGHTEVQKTVGGNAAEYVNVKLDGNASGQFTLDDFSNGKTFTIKDHEGSTNSIYATLKTNQNYDKVVAGNNLRTAMLANISCTKL